MNLFDSESSDSLENFVPFLNEDAPHIKAIKASHLSPRLSQMQESFLHKQANTPPIKIIDSDGEDSVIQKQ